MVKADVLINSRKQEYNIAECFIQLFQENVHNDSSLFLPLLGTQTLTEAKEERDQDLANSTFTMGTQTRTDSREECDSDQANSSNYNIIPSFIQPICGTQTGTRTREEPDQDESNKNFGVLN